MSLFLDIYHENLGEKEKIKEEFNKFLSSSNSFKLKEKILLSLYDHKYKTLEDLEQNLKIKQISKYLNQFGLLQNDFITFKIIIENNDKRFNNYSITEKGKEYLRNFITSNFILKNSYIGEYKQRQRDELKTKTQEERRKPIFKELNEDETIKILKLKIDEKGKDQPHYLDVGEYLSNGHTKFIEYLENDYEGWFGTSETPSRN